ncbi:MAG: glycosyltransferase family 39 protein [Lentimicrobiaceae bacterium]|jgi:hypothetical protein|nr:glycosyltransferase family 39 protein [Lentimicrobiaceae bacterium]MDD4596621.1 glycosyltransferase family 39 protein [Lentimicrobiaceae bacterium]MDY0025502.1 glycosyltransferase family 39 protein [Lentimicrobium sp.]
MKQDMDTKYHLSNRHYYVWTGIILFMALAMRLYHLNFSYSNDELSALSRTLFSSFSDLISKGVLVDFHPAGIQIFLYYWVKLFGMDMWVVRLPFAIAGTLAIWLSMLTFARWFGRQAGLFSGAVLTFMELSLLYSQIARPYGSGFLLSMLTIYFWTLFLQKDKPRYDYALGFALSAAACLYNHHFSGLFAFMAGITGFFILPRTHLKLYLAAGFVATLLYIPHLSITFAQMSIGGVGEWLGKPSRDWPLQHFSLLFNHSWMVAAIILLAGVAQWKFYKPYKGSCQYRIIALIFFGAPMVIGFFYSVFINPVLQHSILIFSAPFLFAFLFSWSYGMPPKVLNVLLTVLLAGGIFHTIFINNYYSTQHFGEFRGIAEKVKIWNEQYGEDNITRAMNTNNPWYLNFYLRTDSTTFVQSENRGGEDLQNLSKLINNSQTPYFMYAWLKPTPLEISDIIQARFPCIVQEADYSGMSKIVLYSRYDEKCSQQLSDTLYFQESAFPENLNDTAKLNFQEYYPGFEGKLPEHNHDESIKIRASADVLTDSANTRALLTFSMHNAQNETIFWTASKLSYFAKESEWSKVLLTVDLPADIPDEHKIKVYLWNPGHERIFIRALCLEQFHTNSTND